MEKQSLTKLLNEYNSLGIFEQIDYDKLYLYSLITHSTAIEGSTVTEIENQLLFDKGLSSTKPMSEQLMNLDLKAAYEKCFEMAKNKQQLSVESLCYLSSLVMKNTGSVYNTISGSFSAANGELRKLNVSAGKGGKSYLDFNKVPYKLEEACKYLNTAKSKLNNSDIEKIYLLSFEAHYILATIHPWADGNGRMSRLVMNMIQKEFNVLPTIVKKENRLEYIKSLNESQENENPKVFLTFMLNHHKDNILEQINEYKKSIEKDFNISNDFDYDR